MAYQGVEHSTVIQRQITRAADADKYFSNIVENNIPIVLVPRWPKLFHFALNVPSGPFVLWQHFQKDMGKLNPGVLWFWPAWNRISHIVTRATITYNAPARNCPTADNVMVNVDLSLTFRIGPDIDGARNFVYKLGAHRFDELLSSETEEAIRGLVYSVTHDKVNDLREEFAVGMLATLNSKVQAYGVQIMNVKITDVKLPRELQERLERTTTFKTKMEEQEKSHENKLRIVEDEAITELETILKTNSRKLQEVEAEKQRFVIEQREMEERAKGAGRVQQVGTKTKVEVAIKKAQGDEFVNRVKGKQGAEALLKKTEIECQKMIIESKQKAHVVIKESEVDLKKSEFDAGAMIASAKVEAEAAKSLEEKRRYELEWARLKVLKKIAGDGRKFISGEKGKQILNDLVPQTKTNRVPILNGVNGFH
uniref:Band 7 domain-containing protein n=3 Tax=Corethron hystrix TaxID=216773 RepID=A0A7S1BD26_9STRA|mmetsp:Transcript_22650/g.51901  ORF Transcript_22650/g.51901 Transcript_22650/m.51901 type:complete len:424 (+) Transcript_22650:143-1414(+)